MPITMHQSWPSEKKNTAQSNQIRRTLNQDSRLYLNENKLANLKRDILRNKRLTDSEITAIKNAVENDLNIRQKENEELNEELNEESNSPRFSVEIPPPDQNTQTFGEINYNESNKNNEERIDI